MKKLNFFTVNDVREIQNRMGSLHSRVHVVTPINRSFVRNEQFTCKEINRAFESAKRSLETESN